MLDLICKNIGRRKTRSGLTIFGIALGIFALTVMGSISESFDSKFQKTLEVGGDKIRVVRTSGLPGDWLTDSKVRDIKRVDGVKDAYGVLMGPVKKSRMGFSNQLVYGIPPEKLLNFLGPMKIISGRPLESEDTYRAVVGSSIARENNLQIGSRLEVIDKNFTIAGILEYTGSFFDSGVFIPLKTTQELYEQKGYLTMIVVIPSGNIESGALSRKIKLDVEDIEVQSADEVKKQMEEAIAVFTVITTGAAVLAAIIGGLSVMNTMLMSISERTREFGILRAMGAETRDILLMCIGEAVLMGMIGGLLGVGSGYLFTSYLNSKIGAGGAELFLVTPRVMMVGMLFVVSLGSLAGIYPAYRTAKLHPVEALKSK